MGYAPHTTGDCASAERCGWQNAVREPEATEPIKSILFF